MPMSDMFDGRPLEPISIPDENTNVLKGKRKRKELKQITLEEAWDKIYNKGLTDARGAERGQAEQNYYLYVRSPYRLSAKQVSILEEELYAQGESIETLVRLRTKWEKAVKEKTEKK